MDCQEQEERDFHPEDWEGASSARLEAEADAEWNDYLCSLSDEELNEHAKAVGPPNWDLPET